MHQSYNFLRASRSIAKTGFRGVFYGGLKMRSKIVFKKWFQRVPKWTPKVNQNRRKGCSGGVSKRDLKKGPSPGSGKVRFWNYLLHFSKVRCLKKDTFLGTVLGTVWETKLLKTGFQSSIKKSAENRHPFYEMLGPFWGPFLSKKSVVCRSKMSLTCGPLKIVILAPSGHPKSTKFEVIFDEILIDFQMMGTSSA